MSDMTYTARWLFPVTTPPLPHGTITIRDGIIVAVEAHGTLTADVDLGNVAVLPGFVNVHTHLDLSGLRGQCPPTPDFTQWLRRVVGFRRTRSADEVRADITSGLQECLRAGTTLIGDISADGASWNPLAEASSRAVVFRELIGLGAERAGQSQQLGRQWLEEHPANDRLVTGLSPHAPYSARRALYQEVGRQTVPVATHLAETRAELELLSDRTGAFVDFLRALNAWDPTGLVVDPAEVMGLLPRGIFVHGNYLDPATVFAPEQSLVVCPRTHAAFGHGRHPFPEMLRRGVRVALGTDSLASNPDLDILGEARFVRQMYPDIAPATILRMLTLNGAEALGVGGLAGSLTQGKSADLVVMPLPDGDRADAHDFVLDSSTRAERVMFRGKWSAPAGPGVDGRA